MNTTLTYSHFYTTGTQDCSNVISLDEFDYAFKTPAKIVEAWAVENLELYGDHRAAWIESQDGEFDTLDADLCYRVWRDGWLARAREIIGNILARGVEVQS